ncbi:MAG TPA: hypothetical protein DCO73_12730, partial [Alphaproteobacteria bacterium]|nr:hypothetical protein [Alphaproteobacteria bacterium]
MTQPPPTPDLFKDAAQDRENLAINQMILDAMNAATPWHEMEPQALRDFLASGGSPLGTPVYSDQAIN